MPEGKTAGALVVAGEESPGLVMAGVFVSVTMMVGGDGIGAMAVSVMRAPCDVGCACMTVEVGPQPYEVATPVPIYVTQAGEAAGLLIP